MFRLSVLQYQWLTLALFGGVILMISLVSLYLMMWRPRVEAPEPAAGARALIRWIPWILYALLFGILVFQVTYAIVLHYHPPNI
jgi:hypothetical protein